MINVTSVTFAESIRFGASNYELMNIDSNRDEHKNIKMVYDQETALLFIIDRDPKLLETEILRSRRFNAVGTANIRCMRMDDVPETLKKHLTDSKKDAKK